MERIVGRDDVDGTQLLDAIRQARIECESFQFDADDVDRLYWAFEHAEQDLEKDLFRATYLASEVVRSIESIGLGRLEEWRKKHGAPKLFHLYGMCLIWISRSS